MSASVQALGLLEEAKRHARRLQLAKANAKARRLYNALIRRLGGRCEVCRTKRGLTVDHVDGRTWRTRELAFRDRVHRYLKEEKSGVRLRVLCGRCNSTDGGKRRWAPFTKAERVAALNLIRFKSGRNEVTFVRPPSAEASP